MNTQMGWMGLALARCAVVSGSLLGSAAVVQADTIQLSGLVSASTEELGKFGATLDYQFVEPGKGLLTVSLLNASPMDNGGFITGFVFDFVSTDPQAKATLLPGSAYPFTFAAGNAQPFGRAFKAGAALGGSFQGGGNPTAGIPVGATGVFVFSIQASDAEMLSAASFASGPNMYDFVVRFRGFADGGSDKVPGVEVCPCDLNYDGVVGSGDVQVILDAWGEAEPGSIADLNGDGMVDGFDLGILLKCWRDCAAAPTGS